MNIIKYTIKILKYHMEKALRPFYKYWYQGSKEVKQREQDDTASTQCRRTLYVLKNKKGKNQDNTQSKKEKIIFTFLQHSSILNLIVSSELTV